MWCVKLSDSQRDALRALVKDAGRAGPGSDGRARGARALPLGRPARGDAPLGPRGGAGRAAGDRRGRRGLGPGRGTAAQSSEAARGRKRAAPPPQARPRRRLSSRRSPRRLLRPSLPSAIRSRTRCGTSAPIDSPIAPDTSSPTKSSSASGPIGWPAPSFMQVSIASGSSPLRSSSRTASNRYGNSSRLTTKPGSVRHLDRGLAERLAERACARASSRRSPRRGTTSSTSFIFAPG